jgi:hypothetical protein
MQAPIEISRRGGGEVSLLDILSHRMSDLAIYLLNGDNFELAFSSRSAEAEIIMAGAIRSPH